RAFRDCASGAGGVFAKVCTAKLSSVAVLPQLKKTAAKTPQAPELPPEMPPESVFLIERAGHA
ncbi:MAG TPA: hypothetical protein VFE24_00850, partial [Pirellulales bacterium]|nr:hypothetical protein [Pirellulales bacterium]